MKKNIFTFILLFSIWGLWYLFYNFASNNNELIAEYGSNMVTDFVNGSLYTSIIYSLFIITIRSIDWFPVYKNFFYTLFHSLIGFSYLFLCYLRFEWNFHWSFLIVIFLISFVFFIKFKFKSSHFVYGTVFSYLFILYFFNNSYDGEKLDYFTRIFFLVSSWANLNVLHLSYISLFIGTFAHFVFNEKESKKKNVSKDNRKTTQNTQKTDISDLF